jgi:hypothetical protein
MNKNLGKLLLFMLFLLSCREGYFPDDIYSTERIPVIQGFISEGSSPMVTLSWTLGYYETSVNYISGATVYIKDDLNNTCELEDHSDGVYVPVIDDLKGTAGRTYTLHVETSEGLEYVSLPQYIHDNPMIDSVFADPETNIRIIYNEKGDPIVDDDEGLFVYTALSNNNESTRYYRFSTTVVQEYEYYLNPNSISPTTVYKWETWKMGSYYNSDSSVTINGRQVVPKYKLGYLRYFYDYFSGNNAASAPVPIAWIVSLKLYSISSDMYDYYNSIDQQLNSDTELFSPVPSQVKSNMHCVTDPNKLVAGAFEASSVSVIYKAFKFIDLEKYRSKLLTDFPEGIVNGSKRNLPPDFWVTL